VSAARSRVTGEGPHEGQGAGVYRVEVTEAEADHARDLLDGRPWAVLTVAGVDRLVIALPDQADAAAFAVLIERVTEGLDDRLAAALASLTVPNSIEVPGG